MTNYLQIGQKIYRWTVISPAWIERKNGRNERRVTVRCDCGNERAVAERAIKRGKSKSCGCLTVEKTVERNTQRTSHGLSHTRMYWVYKDAKARCTNPKHKAWNNYGGRGIEFRFKNLEEFVTELGPKPTEHHSVDRIDNDGHYEKGNVRWATTQEQCNNRRSNKPP